MNHLLESHELGAEGDADQRAPESDGRLNRVRGDDDQSEQDKYELDRHVDLPVPSFLQGFPAFVQVGLCAPFVSGIAA